jgi:hypothetical protein
LSETKGTGTEAGATRKSARSNSNELAKAAVAFLNPHNEGDSDPSRARQRAVFVRVGADDRSLTVAARIFPVVGG